MNLTPNNITDSSDKQMTTPFLHSTTVRVKIHVSHWLRGTQPAQNQVLSVTMDDVNERCISLV